MERFAEKRVTDAFFCHIEKGGGKRMMDKHFPKISQCMIVKNEEKNIEKALTWAKDIAYEQIVVDTGSTDRTVEIAESMGARVYHFTWIDDFSAAKNYAIDLASGEWIALLDADEYLSEEEAAKLPEFLAKVRKEYYGIAMSWLQMEDTGRIMSGGTQIRVFRNIKELRYRNRIHEELFLEGGPLPVLDACSRFSIFHTGYGEMADGQGQKGKRNIPIILKELEERPDNYHMMGYLADSYSTMGEKEKAREWYYKAIRHMPEVIPDRDSRSVTTFEWLLVTLRELEADEAELLEVYNQAVKKIPKDADFDFLIGEYYRNKHYYQKAVYHLKRSIELLDQYGIAERSMIASGRIQDIWTYLAEGYYYSGELPGCVSAATTVLKANPYVSLALETLVKAFFSNVSPGAEEKTSLAVAGFLMKLYNLENRKDRLFLVMVLGKLPYPKLTRQFRQICTPEELAAVDEARDR